MKKIYLIFLLLIFSGTSLFSQLSKTHYIPPVIGPTSTSGPGAQILYISTPSKTPVNFTVRNGGVIGTTVSSGTIYESGQVSNNNPYPVLIASQPAKNSTGQAIQANNAWTDMFLNFAENTLILEIE